MGASSTCTVRRTGLQRLNGCVRLNLSPPRLPVCRSVDVVGFWEMMHEALDAADAASPLDEHGTAPLLTAAVL